MKYPPLLPAGTTVEVGQREGNHRRILPSAVGVVLKIKEDIRLKKEGDFYFYFACDAEVLNPKDGWQHKEISHRINLIYDKIIEGNNKDFKGLLDSVEGGL